MFCKKCGAIIEQPKSKAVPILIAVIVILVIAVATLSVLLIMNINKNNCNGTSNGQIANQEQTTTTTTEDLFYRSNKNEIKEVSFKDVKAKPEDNKESSNNIEYVNAFYEQSSATSAYAYLLMNNKNTSGMYDVTAYINYYKDGQRIGSDRSTAYCIRSNQRFVMDVMLSYHDAYDSIDITFTTNKSKSTYEELPIDQSKIRNEKVGGKIVALYPTKPSEKTSYWAAIVYKKDGKIVYANNAVNSFYSNEEEQEFSFFTTKLKDIQYDDYEINIYSAYQRNDY